MSVIESSLGAEIKSIADTEERTEERKGIIEIKEIVDIFSTLLKGEGENIFLVSHILKDGIGDAVLYARLAQKFTEFPIISGYNIFYLVTCSKKQEKEVLEKLRDYGLDTKTHLVCHLDAESPEAGLKKYLRGDSEKQKELSQAILKPHVFYNFSTREMEKNILPSLGFPKTGLTATKPGEVPIASISDLGGSSFKRRNRYNVDGSFVLQDQDIEDLSYSNGPLLRILGTATRHHGMLLTLSKEKVSKAQSLASIQDKRFLSALLRKKISSFDDFDEKQAGEFLNSRLLVPAYFQEGPEVFANIVYSLAQYGSKQKCKEVVISVNKGNFDNAKFKMSLFRQYNISEVAYITPEKRQKISVLKEASDNSIKITILEGFHLSDSDYLALVKSAHLYGCSGDNSLDMAISLGVFPINQVRTQKREFWNSFIISLACLAPELDFGALTSMGYLNAKECALHTKEYQQGIVNEIFDTKLMAAWPSLMKKFQAQYNFFDIYPSIVAQVLCLARINQLSKTAATDPRIPLLQELERGLDIEINARETKPHEAIVARLLKKTEIISDIQKFGKERTEQRAEQILELRAGFFGPNALMAIFKALAVTTNIRKLFFSECARDAKEVWKYFLEMLSKNKSINQLDLANIEITPEMLGSLVAVLIKKPEIQAINLSNNFMTVEHAPHLMRLLQGLPKLEHLDLSFTDMSDQVVSAFAPGLLKSKLKHLVLDLNPRLTIISFSTFLPIKTRNPEIGHIVLD